MTADALLDRYRDLQAKLNAARTEVAEAEHLGRTQPDRPADCIRELCSYERAVAFAQRERNEVEERRLALRIAEAIASGVALPRAVDPQFPARGFVLLDPTLLKRQDDARTALVQAQTALAKFVSKNGKVLEAGLENEVLEVEQRIVSRTSELHADETRSQELATMREAIRAA